MTLTNTAVACALAPESGTQWSTSDLGLDSIVLLKRGGELQVEPTGSESEHRCALEIVVMSLGEGISARRFPEAWRTELFKR